MFDVNTVWPFRLTRGHSKDPSKGACLMDAVSWFEYGMLGDHPDCVSPLLTQIGVVANDCMRDRQQLIRFIPLLPGTSDSKETTRALWAQFMLQRLVDTWDKPLKVQSRVVWGALRGHRYFDVINGGIAAYFLHNKGSAPPMETVVEMLRALTFAVRYVKPAIRDYFSPTLWPWNMITPVVHHNVVTLEEELETTLISILEVGCALRDTPVEPWGAEFVACKIAAFEKAREHADT